MRRLLCVWLCVLLVGVAGAGTAGATHGCAFPYETTDATGAVVQIPEDPDRIVTLTPSAAQTMWEIDAFDEVVATSTYAGYLPGAEQKQVISAETDQAMVERIVAVEPTLILVPNASHDPAVVGQLRGLGIPTVVFGERSSLEEIADQTEQIGRLTGNCAAGELRATQLRTTIAAMESVVADVEQPRGLNSFYGYSSGADTFTDDIMATAGVRNIAAARFAGWQQLSAEVVATDDPEWIIAPEGSPIPDSPAYTSTTAVESGQIVSLDTDELQQPAPRAVNATATVLARVHPTAHRALIAQGPWYPLQDPPRFETTTVELDDATTTVTVRPTEPVSEVRVTPSWATRVTADQPDDTGSYVLELPADGAAAGGHLEVALEGPDGLESVRTLGVEPTDVAPPTAVEPAAQLWLLPVVVAVIAAPLVWLFVRRDL
jgi:iron complex transport system substrate-binding protein